jgi:hypothetical protein
VLIAVALFAGLALATIQASFVEWAFHRYWLHRPWLPEGCFTAHTLIHHQLCKFDDTFHVEHEEQEEALSFQWWAGPVLIAIIVSPWALASWGLWAVGFPLPFVPFLLSFTATVVLYYLGYEGLHHMMHKPGPGFLERSRYFQFIKKHHRIHHAQMDRNLNVLVPIADFFLGTLVLDAPLPVTTPGNAVKLARRHSDYGKRLGEEGR